MKYFQPELYKPYMVTIDDGSVLRIFYKKDENKICFFNIYIQHDLIEQDCYLIKFMKYRNDHELIDNMPEEMNISLIKYIFEEFE